VVEPLRQNLEPLRVHGHRVHRVRRIFPPHGGEQSDVELLREVEDLEREDAIAPAPCMGGLDELPPLDLVVLGPHVGIARREPLHLPGKVGALELEQRPVEVSPPGGVHRHRAQAEERCAALQKRFAVGMRIASFVNVEEDHADP